MAFASWDAPKDPQAIRDYGIDWSTDIGDLTIVSSSWDVVSGTVVVDQDGHTDSTTVARLSGGASGETAELLNHIVLSDGQEDEKTCRLKVKDQ